MRLKGGCADGPVLVVGALGTRPRRAPLGGLISVPPFHVVVGCGLFVGGVVVIGWLPPWQGDWRKRTNVGFALVLCGLGLMLPW